jgi:hypothetical protein
MFAPVHAAPAVPGATNAKAEIAVAAIAEATLRTFNPVMSELPPLELVVAVPHNWNRSVGIPPECWFGEPVARFNMESIEILRN